MKTVDIQNHQRILNTFTGTHEKKLLIWISQRLPGWVTPDMLTIVGVFGAFVVFGGYALCNIHPAFLWLANLGFVINWFGDSLDGTLARVRKIERPVYGFYVDHATDAFVEILLFLGVGVSPFVQFELACLALIGYLVLSVLVYLRTCVRGEFTISYGKLGPTEGRLIAMSANALIFFIGNPQVTLFQLSMSAYDWIVVGIILLLLVITVSTALRQARILAEQDPPGGNRS
ncbi:MAG: CDP-alcohol phosphatidyltransferase family protein [Anaerolineales bacterium]|nr:CDP-alcohol phosphatidyltransferase family protein [Anaerolineales bacterium]